MDHFKGRVAVLATMHGKERVIAPILEKELGVRVVVPENFNTDQFGTFTRDIARSGNQLEAARLKAKAAMEIMGADLGIASEGSFGADPHMPFIQSNLELLILIDEKNKWEVRGHHRSPNTNMAGQYVSSAEEAVAFAKRIGFPEHAVIVRTSEKSSGPMYKGVKTEEELIQRVSKLLKGLFTKRVYVETDMRAHMNPTRMGNIAKATEDLIQNIRSECPSCAAPGFVIVDAKPGLACSKCKLPTDSPASYIRRCQQCGTEKEILREDKLFEDPALCNWCNP